MNRRKFLGAAAAGTVSTAATGAVASQPPNIVIIYTDDLGFGDLGCYGSRIPTPNFDGLATDGIMFRHCVSGGAVCSPARAALMTGRYGPRFGIPDVMFPTDTFGIPDSETTIAQMLKSTGYQTMCVGKWHLGSSPKYLPTNRGFDEFYGMPYSHDMTPSVLMHNTSVIEQPVQINTLTQRYTAQAVNFIQRAGGSSFFLYLAHNAPHLPLFASQGFQGKSDLGPYGDTIMELDWSVGQVMQALKDNGVDQNTLVIYSSDHGPWYNGNAGRLRGRKGETWEGGMRVPLIARLPGAIPSGTVAHSLTTIMDVLPTLATVSGARLPANRLDGVDIWPVMTGQQRAVQRDLVLYFDSWNLQCARMGRWKMHLARYNTYAWSPAPPGGRINLPLSNPELYDVHADPGESFDTADRNPQVIADMRAAVYRQLSTFPQQVTTAWNNTFLQKVQYTSSGSLPILQS